MNQDAKVNKLILIVEDDPPLRETMEEILQLESYTCVPAANANEALELLNAMSTIPNLILSDILMQGMDGFQYLMTVRANSIWTQIPFLFVSGQETTGILYDTELGTVAYLTKPFEVKRLFNMVKELLAI